MAKQTPRPIDRIGKWIEDDKVFGNGLVLIGYRKGKERVVMVVFSLLVGTAESQVRVKVETVETGRKQEMKKRSERGNEWE